MKLVVGLGNPGREYEKTKHNVGFLVLDHYLDGEKWDSKDKALYIKKGDVVYIKPQTYMNLSGGAVGAFVNFYKIDPKDVLVIHDDLDLEANTFRLKNNSSAGGHNGIKDIIRVLGTNGFGRLKIGIKRNTQIDAKDFVLSKFDKESLDYLNSKIFSEILDDFKENDINYLMNKYNKCGKK